MLQKIWHLWSSLQKCLFGVCCTVPPRALLAKKTSQSVSDSLVPHLCAMQTTQGFSWQWKPSQLTARDGPMQCWDYFASGSKAWAPLRRSVIGLHVLLGSGLGACIFLDSLSVLPYDSSLLSHFPTNPQTGNIFIYLFLLNIFFKAIGKIACPQERKTRNQRDNKGTKLSLGSLFDFPVIHELWFLIFLNLASG